MGMRNLLPFLTVQEGGDLCIGTCLVDTTTSAAGDFALHRPIHSVGVQSAVGYLGEGGSAGGFSVCNVV